MNFVFICEGEKDCDAVASLGLIATCAPGGAGKWKPEFSEMLRDRNVVILPDNDEAGELGSWKIARALEGIATSVAIVRLPNLPPKGDVTDYLEAGGGKYELIAFAETASIRAARKALENGFKTPSTKIALDGIDAALAARMPTY